MSVKTVPAGPAFEHVERMLGRFPGLTPTHFSRLAGLSHSGLPRARNGMIYPETAERILAVHPRHLAMCPPPQMPTSIPREHVLGLMEETGVYRNTIARAAGVNYQTVYNVVTPKWPHVKWRIYAALMALTADDLIGAHYWLDRTPSVTRLRALQANGWSLSGLGRAHGMNLLSMVNGDRDSPTHAPVARRIEALYESIGDEPGGDLRAAQTALALGYFPPIHYDDDMNLAAEDDEASLAQQEARRCLRIVGLTLDGRSVAEVVAAARCSERHVAPARRHAGIAIGRTLAGGYEAIEERPGAFSTLRAALARVHYRSTLDVLDEPGLDYVALWEALGPVHQGRAARAAA